MSTSSEEIIIVGAGLSGLACAIALHQAGKRPLLLEASDGPGGRVRTDEVDGFLLDRGFQVYLDAYPKAGQLLDLRKLDLQAFEPGALVFRYGKLHRVIDAFRRPKELINSALAPIGNLFDKARVGRLRFSLLRKRIEDIAESEDKSTEQYLRDFGFSSTIIDRFFRSFYGGIFLERELSTSSRMFEFTFKMFSKGSATLPAQGMGQISKQLAQQLPEDCIRYDSLVTQIKGTDVHLASGEVHSASQIVVATPVHQAGQLLLELKIPDIGWRSVTNLYFSASKSPINEALIVLNGEGSGLVNNVAVLTDVVPGYAPDGQALISVSVLGLPTETDLPQKVQEELEGWFGSDVKTWKHLRTDRIPHALPEQLPQATALPEVKAPYYLCGDYCVSASIEGAIISGQETASKLLSDLV